MAMFRFRVTFFGLLMLISFTCNGFFALYAESFTPSELYPACVDVTDIWPPPNSILEPVNEDTWFSDYSIAITFSRPIKFHSLANPIGSLSVSATKFLDFYPYYSRFVYGSERSILLLFRIPNSLRYIK